MYIKASVAVAALLTAGAADAAGRLAPNVPAAPSVLHHVQYRDADVFFDNEGNRILMDRETGEIISVQPARPQRTRPMRRPLQPDDGYYRDEPDYEADAFPDAPAAPRDYGRAPDSQLPESPDVARGEGPRSPIERKPLTSPDTAPQRPGDEPAFRQPGAPAVPPSTEQAATPPAAQPVPGAPSGETTGTVAATEPPAAAKPATAPSIVVPGGGGPREDVASLQILLDRVGASPGVIDGRFGSNVDKAIVAYRRITGKDLKSFDTEGIRQALAETGGDPFMQYTLTAEDVAGPYVASVPEDYGEKAKLERLGFTSVTEALGERFHMDENYLKALNPEANFNRVGTIIKVANVGQNITAKVARITADKDQKLVLAYDAYDKLVAAYPATIGSSDTPSPVGTHAVSRIAFNPEYTYNPKLNFKQGNNSSVLRIPPGPNGPVGSIWIALDKPTYGVHGTPEPSKIGKTESHGCVRLTNWDAAELAKMVSAGVTVEFME